ncbi:aldose epimerase family protein [Zobellia galactanivorans]|uniref:aldose epimerase family protein n=1 Tax=Zobellia galactanivorans (strain DSM 12802 / CCUG 47099 / CIP 106680 / NCIMB 13871 / Dsij) TaxID=63186 RepID=UPI0026E3ACAE|nr:aldose epimerase family protein [Zobellia galactanivorans]MDO6808159.1 aldose epimerase family protein [Zobellia galactanivorans]
MKKILCFAVFFTLVSYPMYAQSIQKEQWGTVKGKEVSLYTVTNKNGMKMQIMNLGCIITSLFVPDKNGKLDDVVLGFDNLEDYVKGHPSFGTTVGRYANRIKDAQFVMNDSVYKLTANEEGTAIHGGNEFRDAVWDAEIVSNENGEGLRFHYLSPDGSFGFPGKLDVYATYLLNDDNAIYVTFEAETDKDTHVSMTNHSYFNLNGAKELIYDHRVLVDADTYTEFDEDITPTGKLPRLKGTAWDLSSMTRLGDKIHDIPLNGYHHCYVLNKEDGEMKKAAEVIEPNSGRKLEVFTTQPGITVYASNGLDNITGKYGIDYIPHMALCLETQDLPDAVNHPNFPSTLLKPGETYSETVVYDFGIVK